MKNTIKIGDKIKLVEACNLSTVVYATRRALKLRIGDRSFWVPISSVKIYKTITGSMARNVTNEGDVHYLHDLPEWLIKAIGL